MKKTIWAKKQKIRNPKQTSPHKQLDFLLDSNHIIHGNNFGKCHAKLAENGKRDRINNERKPGGTLLKATGLFSCVSSYKTEISLRSEIRFFFTLYS